ncbi:response regulator [Lederbergia citri]|uniref:Response regulator n=1 Tax=Lederbergia citri TaxID=2833580 RepID=A0A942TJG1_9BACI|nr:response regulator [Lederbergia citri]MBS4197757.1 response regulator [Lederbergia citri]
MDKSVLIADDSSFMRKWLKDMLDKGGFYVILEAHDGQDAIQKYKAFSPDILLLDLTMPKVNGLDVLKEIRDYDSSANVIICSAMGQKYLIKEALHCGAKDFVIKPYFNNLLTILKNMF